MDTYRLDIWFGTIQKAIAAAINEAASRQGLVTFDFNGVEVTVAADSDSTLIYRDWSRAMNGYTGKAAGPHPAAELTPDELASDARIEAEHETRRKADREACEAKQKARADALATETAGASFTFAPGGIEAWGKGLDAQESDYGRACFTYAEAWGRLMEARIATGKPLAEIAEQASHDADVGGITGFMYGVAVSILSQTWKHGEELRRWHNLKTQIRDEGEKANESGGVLNPALLSVA